MSSLRRAIEIAASAHDGQVDRGGSPYILHPLRVMLAQDTEEARIAAVLHDVVEDSDDWTLDRLEEEGFSPTVLEAVAVLTKDDPEDYVEYLTRIARVPLAVRVKVADLTDNLDPTRLGHEPTDADMARFAKYVKALESFGVEPPETWRRYTESKAG